MGECDKVQSYKILDKFVEMGGNFIDTANNYQGGQSEAWLGDWMQERGNRDQMVYVLQHQTSSNYRINRDHQHRNQVYFAIPQP